MARLLYGTTWIQEDEPCYNLVEMNLQSPGQKGFHRYQIIKVMRGGVLTEYREDLGKATKHKGVPQINVLGGILNEETGKFEILETVGRLREIALTIRTGTPQIDVRELVSTQNIIQR